jgi:putative tricarboxylic transport membrane protein
MKVSDLAAGLAFVCFGLALAGYGFSLPPMPGQRYGAGLFPFLLGLCLAGCGLSLAWSGRRGGVPLVQLAAWSRDRAIVANLALTLALIVVYVLFSDEIGFVPLSIAMLMVLFWRLHVPPRRGLVIALAATLTIQYGFGNLLRVPLPRGLLGAVPW